MAFPIRAQGAATVTSVARSWLLAILIVAAAGPVQAQFDSGSSGADGALSFTCAPGGETIEWDAAGLDPENDNVFHFTTINVPADCTIVMKSRILGQEPIVWLAQGAVTIGGTIDLSGEQGHSSAIGNARLPALPGPGGFAGGLGLVNSIGTTTDGLGPGAGGAGPGTNFAGGAGHATGGQQFICCNAGSAYGTNFLRPLLGGSGGGGASGGGGGAGGGAILIASTTGISVDGQIRSDGGAAGGGNSGSGSGGAIRLAAPVVSGGGTIQAGGNIAAVDGAAGRIRIETDDYQFTGATLAGSQRVVTLADTTILTSPSDLAFPVLRVVSVDGVPVPPNPTGGFDPTDVTIDNPNPVDIAIEAENVPLGTAVTVEVHNETTGTTTFNSAPLAGTLALSTAVATGQVDAGFSSVTLRASFAP